MATNKQKKINEAASLLGKRSAAVRKRKWGKKEFDRKMREVADHSPNLDAGKIAILAALNLVNEPSFSSEDGEEAEDGRFVEMVERVSSLTSDLEAALDS